jgi:hypothetical protein
LRFAIRFAFCESNLARAQQMLIGSNLEYSVASLHCLKQMLFAAILHLFLCFCSYVLLLPPTSSPAAAAAATIATTTTAAADDQMAYNNAYSSSSSSISAGVTPPPLPPPPSSSKDDLLLPHSFFIQHQKQEQQRVTLAQAFERFQSLLRPAAEKQSLSARNCTTLTTRLDQLFNGLLLGDRREWSNLYALGVISAKCLVLTTASAGKEAADDAKLAYGFARLLGLSGFEV